MNYTDIFHETYIALLANKVRTGLTMLGIVIGIGSVIALVSIGQGAQSSIQANIQSIGSNLIMVIPGAQGGPGFQISQGRGTARSLTVADADALVSIPGVKEVAPELNGRYQVTAKGTNTNTSVVGVTSAYPDVRNLKIDQGTFISDQNNRSLSKVAIIGPTARDDLFGEGADPIGKTIRIKGNEFKIIGLTVTKGGSGFGSQDDMIFIPLTVAQKFLVGDSYVSTISIQAESSDQMSQIQQEITSELLVRHNVRDPQNADFSTLNQGDIVATASSITNTFTIFLAAVAGISLLVGGIGIMNMMLTTVTERTREIGLRKAIGAKAADINKQFLIEAITLTFVGGLIGVLCGGGVSFLVTHFGILQTKITISSVLLSFGVSALIGVIFGYYPARRASHLNPIDALRYE